MTALGGSVRGHRARRARSGFTLIELLVAMALFALISLAGFTLLSGIIGTRDRLDGRLARVAELQRAMYLMTLDFEAMGEGAFDVAPNEIRFQRLAPGATDGVTSVGYALVDRDLHRRTSGGADQTVVKGVSAAQWRFLDASGTWNEQVTIPPAIGAPAPPRPRAIEITLVLTDDKGGLSGPLRRVVELPRQP